MARRIPDVGAPEVVVLATRNSKARPTIVGRFLKSWRAASPPPSLAANSTVTRPSSGTALLQTSSIIDKRRLIRKYDSREPLTRRIAFGKNFTPPVPSVAVTTLRALALSWKGSSVAPVRLTRVAAAEAMVV